MEVFLSRMLQIFVLAAVLKPYAADNGLKWVKAKIPQYKAPGETAVLECEYNLGNDTLYSVKWYKDNEEFFRFIPKSYMQSSSYPVEGVHVDMSKSDTNKVVLHNVNWKTGGTYRCEVSAEAPSFTSAQSDSRMEIVSLPDEDPFITGMEEQYQIGNEINLNCTSGRSRPASQLRWYINEQQIQKPEALIHYPFENQAKGLMRSTLGLRFHLTNRHFAGGSMVIKCIASMAPSVPFSGEDTETVIQNILTSTDKREALLLVKNTSHRNKVNVALYFIYVSILII